MKKNVAILLMTAVLLSGGISFAGQVAPNPITEYASYEELLLGADTTMANPADLGWVDTLTFASIDEDPQIAQIEFQVEGRVYTYRGAKAETADDAARLKDTMHGVHFTEVAEQGAYTFDAASIDLPDDVAYEFTQGTDKAMLYTWYLPEAGTQYSLYSADAYKTNDGEMVDLVQDLISITPKG